MITRPTVLILGAGASMPYGFPSGKQLVIEINNLYKKEPQFLETITKASLNNTNIENKDLIVDEITKLGNLIEPNRYRLYNQNLLSNFIKKNFTLNEKFLAILNFITLNPRNSINAENFQNNIEKIISLILKNLEFNQFKNYETNYVHKFFNVLEDSAINSIDTFLEARAQHKDYMQIGKAAISYSLLKFEINSIYPLTQSVDANEDWYPYLRDNLFSSSSELSKFNQNKLKIITFNYDRSLEFFLRTSSLALYGETYSALEINKFLSSLEILHMHGSLGPLNSNIDDSIIQYGTKKRDCINSPEIIRKSSNYLRVIHEDVNEEKIFKRAKNYIDEAEVVCFLGFGFNNLNLELIGFSEKNSSKYSTKKIIHGTVMGVSDKEISTYTNKFKKLGFDSPNFLKFGNLNFLRETGILISE